jgi:hypothetical protein
MTFWTGIVHVSPRPGNDLLKGDLGAVVPVVGLADSESQFLSSLTGLFDKWQFDVVEIKDIEHCEEVESRIGVSEEIVNLAKNLTTNDPVGFGVFHTYRAR